MLIAVRCHCIYILSFGRQSESVEPQNPTKDTTKRKQELLSTIWKNNAGMQPKIKLIVSDDFFFFAITRSNRVNVDVDTPKDVKYTAIRHTHAINFTPCSKAETWVYIWD